MVWGFLKCNLEWGIFLVLVLHVGTRQGKKLGCFHSPDKGRLGKKTSLLQTSCVSVTPEKWRHWSLRTEIFQNPFSIIARLRKKQACLLVGGRVIVKQAYLYVGKLFNIVHAFCISVYRHSRYASGPCDVRALLALGVDAILTCLVQNPASVPPCSTSNQGDRTRAPSYEVISPVSKMGKFFSHILFSQEFSLQFGSEASGP